MSERRRRPVKAAPVRSEEEEREYKQQCREFRRLIRDLLSSPDFRRFINGVLYNGMNIDLEVFTGNSATYYRAGREAICKSILRSFYQVAKVDPRVKTLLRILNAERMDIELEKLDIKRSDNNEHK